jgi:hypothetical protein
MKNKLNLLLLSFCKSHSANGLSFFKKWGEIMWQYLNRKPIKTTFCCQLILGLILTTLTIPLYIGRHSTLPKAFNELISIESSTFLLCFGVTLVLLPILLPFRALHCIKLVGIEAMRLAMGGVTLVLGIIFGMIFVFIASCEYQYLCVCIIGAFFMIFLVFYCAFGLTLHKACESVAPKPGRKWWQAGALAFVISLAYLVCL